MDIERMVPSERFELSYRNLEFPTLTVTYTRALLSDSPLGVSWHRSANLSSWVSGAPSQYTPLQALMATHLRPILSIAFHFILN